jgi:proteasome lid subunit RPN8/RPN11
MISTSAWDAICEHAQRSFPEECCGVVLSNGMTDHIRQLKNIQNDLHALDPKTYPRTAAIAYTMDVKELEEVLHQAEREGANLKAFYHSHPDHEAYFSEEDKAFACPFGEPTFPNTAQIVVSIYGRIVRRISAFAWSEETQDFTEVPIKII